MEVKVSTEYAAARLASVAMDALVRADVQRSLPILNSEWSESLNEARKALKGALKLLDEE